DPKQVYYETGRRLVADGVITVDPLGYAAARHAADSNLVGHRGTHVPLLSVTQETAARLGLPQESAKALYEAELDCERALCRAVPGVEHVLARARRETGRGVVFISDTPHPEFFVR